MFFSFEGAILFTKGRIVYTHCRRWASKKYSKTLNLPKTSFPLSMKNGVIPKREKDIQKTCGFSELYSWQRQEDRPEFILHDGPPYANGDPHVGHALNKILKDITNRYKLLRGYKVHYVPGWDCHGVPIEQKALAQLREDFTVLEPPEIRHKARKFAEKTIRKQMSAFKRWGVMADWDKGCYYTYNKDYEADQLEIFFDMYEKGLIYQDYMPVYWSPSSRTALAEAELEYNEHHKSTAVYVKFRLDHLPDPIHDVVGGSDIKKYAVIWTTTPWTLPANKAICFGLAINYSFVRCASNKEVYLVCSEFVDKLQQIVGEKLETLITVEGLDLKGSTYRHPLTRKLTQTMLPATHVTDTKGTGLVHTAPAHGPEDFQVAINFNLSRECCVDEGGVYTKEAGSILEGKNVLAEGNDFVLSLFGNEILHREEIEHSYPYDWRTKEPVILRASKQWFVNTSKIKKHALESLKEVEILPRSSEQGMLSQLDMRTYWCVSRQRVWGVPIPVFYAKSSSDVLLTRASVDHIKSVVRDLGSDAWWSLQSEQLLPKSVIEMSGFDSKEEYVKGTDIMDIWFDSGSSWSHVLPGGVADVYLEGIDQFGGWFQSSLLTSIATTSRAPYKKLVVHGFTVDEKGCKMSKSVGNVVDPEIIINGGKNREEEPAYGADVLRWWTALAHLDSKVNIGPVVLQRCQEQIFRVRKSVRYMLGNLHGFELQHMVPYSELLPQDKYLLHLLYKFTKQVLENYEGFYYDRVLLSVEKFINTSVSAFHCNISKDRLYCSVHDAADRRSGQTVQCLVSQIVARCLAPIVPHLAEEIFSHLPQHTDAAVNSIFKTKWEDLPLEWYDPELVRTMELVLSMKDLFNSSVAGDSHAEFDLVICAKPYIFKKIKVMQQELTSHTSPLCEVLQASSTTLLSRLPLVIPDESSCVEASHKYQLKDGTESEDKYLMVILPAEKYLCERCRRYTADKKDEPCERCMDALTNGWQ